jgi:hypothetical protein
LLTPHCWTQSVLQLPPPPPLEPVVEDEPPPPELLVFDGRPLPELSDEPP